MKARDVTEAIALLYDEEFNDAPVIVSKGNNLLAKKMLELAKKNNIAVIENEDIASELIKLDVGREIPYALYEAVSVILAFVYKLKEIE